MTSSDPLTPVPSERLLGPGHGVGVWPLRERLALATALLDVNNQQVTWNAISRRLLCFSRPDRPSNWCSPKACAKQYALLLDSDDLVRCLKQQTQLHLPMNDSAADNHSNMVGGQQSQLSRTERIVKRLSAERADELRLHIRQGQQHYSFFKKMMNDVETGQYDDVLSTLNEQLNQLTYLFDNKPDVPNSNKSPTVKQLQHSLSTQSEVGFADKCDVNVGDNVPPTNTTLIMDTHNSEKFTELAHVCKQLKQIHDIPDHVWLCTPGPVGNRNSLNNMVGIGMRSRTAGAPGSGSHSRLSTLLHEAKLGNLKPRFRSRHSSSNSSITSGGKLFKQKSNKNLNTGVKRKQINEKKHSSSTSAASRAADATRHRYLSSNSKHRRANMTHRSIHPAAKVGIKKQKHMIPKSELSVQCRKSCTSSDQSLCSPRPSKVRQRSNQSSKTKSCSSLEYSSRASTPSTIAMSQSSDSEASSDVDNDAHFGAGPLHNTHDFRNTVSSMASRKQTGLPVDNEEIDDNDGGVARTDSIHDLNSSQSTEAASEEMVTNPIDTVGSDDDIPHDEQIGSLSGNVMSSNDSTLSDVKLKYRPTEPSNGEQLISESVRRNAQFDEVANQSCNSQVSVKARKRSKTSKSKLPNPRSTIEPFLCRMSRNINTEEQSNSLTTYSNQDSSLNPSPLRMTAPQQFASTVLSESTKKRSDCVKVVSPPTATKQSPNPTENDSSLNESVIATDQKSSLRLRLSRQGTQLVILPVNHGETDTPITPTNNNSTCTTSLPNNGQNLSPTNLNSSIDSVSPNTDWLLWANQILLYETDRILDLTDSDKDFNTRSKNTNSMPKLREFVHQLLDPLKISLVEMRFKSKLEFVHKLLSVLAESAMTQPINTDRFRIVLRLYQYLAPQLQFDVNFTNVCSSTPYCHGYLSPPSSELCSSASSTKVACSVSSMDSQYNKRAR